MSLFDRAITAFQHFLIHLIPRKRHRSAGERFDLGRDPILEWSREGGVKKRPGG